MIYDESFNSNILLWTIIFHILHKDSFTLLNMIITTFKFDMYMYVNIDDFPIFMVTMLDFLDILKNKFGDRIFFTISILKGMFMPSAQFGCS